MTREREQALKLAIKALEQMRHKIAFDAGLADVYGATYQHAQRASQLRKEINQAIEQLQQIRAELKAQREKPLLEEVRRKKQRQRQQRNQPSLFGESK